LGVEQASRDFRPWKALGLPDACVKRATAGIRFYFARRFGPHGLAPGIQGIKFRAANRMLTIA
jgi:hypothetical protein